jgi:4-hydroxy-2-oxoheptanedioate aldolase
MKNVLKAKLESGKNVVGTFFEIGGTAAIECLGLTGLDFMVIDTEHGPFDVESAMEYIRVAELHGITPLVRTKNHQRASILKMLDVGAKGLIIPNIHTIEEVKEIVEYGKYAPVGNRGFFMGRTAGYGYNIIAKDVPGYFNTCNRETMLIPQCETVGCLENIETIAAMAGVDGIFVGPFDLSISMGIPAQFDHPDFKAALKRIVNACKAAGVPAFIFAGNADGAKVHFANGFEGVAINTDASVYIQAYKSILDDLAE